MLRVALPEFGDGTIEVFDGAVVLAGAAGHASVKGVDVAECNVVVGVAEDGFGVVRAPFLFFYFAFLQQNPTLEDFRERGHLGKTERQRVFFAVVSEDQPLLNRKSTLLISSHIS